MFALFSRSGFVHFEGVQKVYLLDTEVVAIKIGVKEIKVCSQLSQMTTAAR